MKRLSIFSLLVPALLSAQVPDHVPTDGLVAWYPLDGEVTNVLDPTEAGSIESATNGTGHDGTAGGSLGFVANEWAYIQPSIGTTEELTVSLWVNEGTNPPNSYQTPIYLGQEGFSADTTYSLDISRDRQNYPSPGLFRTNLNYNFGYVGYTELDGGWVHVTSVFDHGQLSIYRNGILMESVSASVDAISVNGPSVIGAGHNTGQDTPFNFCHCALDEIGIWTRALNGSEIAGIHSEQPIPQVPDYVPTDGLVAYYPLDSTALDASDNGHHLTLDGPTWGDGTEDADDQALLFDGQDDVALIPHHPDFNSPEMSLSFWVNVHTDQLLDSPGLSDFMGMINKTDLEAPVLDRRQFDVQLYAESAGTSPFNLGWLASTGQSVNGLDVELVTAPANLPAFEWNHIVVTASDSTLGIHINGEHIATNALLHPRVLNTADIQIGRNYLGLAQRHFNGRMDDIAFYNRVLTAEEMTGLYQSSSSEDPCFDFSEVPAEIHLDNGPVTLQLGPGESSPQAGSNGEVTISEPGLFVLERSVGDAHLSLVQDSSWVDFGDILNDLTPPVSFSFDVRLTGNGGPILATDNGNPSYYNGYWISLSPSQLACNYGDGGWHGGGERRTGRVYSDFAQNEWYHITCVVNGANDFAFYLDGVEQTTSYNDAGFGGAVNFTNDPMKLGHHNAASPGTGAFYDQCFTGDLNNVTVWHRALNGAEAAALQEGGLPEDLTALVAHWDFNGTSGGVVVDGSGLGHDGQLMGNATISTAPECTTTDTIAVHYSGCTDEAACNYDPTATQDDGSCGFSPVITLPADTSTFESTLLLDASPDFGASLWSTGETGGTITVTESGQYSVQVMQNGSVNRSVHFDATSTELADFSAVTSAIGNEGTIAIDFKIETPETATPDLGGTWSVPSYPLFFMDNGTGDPLVIRIGRGCYATASSISLEDDDCGQSNPNVRASWGTNPLHFFDGAWHRIALSSGEEGHALYVDGNLLSLDYSLGDPSINVWPEDANAFSIARNFHENWDFVGELDNLMVWTSSLTFDQASSLDPCQVNPTSPDLLGFWPFDGGDSAVALDASGNDHHGVLDASRTLQPAQTACSPCFAESTVMVQLLIANCTDSLACNYNAMAVLDDGSCDYSCCPGPGCCADGTVWDAQLGQCVGQSSPCDTVFLSIPSCGTGTVWDPVAQECIVAIPTDTDFDGCITAGDVLNLLATFGTCPPIPEWPEADLDMACMTWSCGDPLVYQGDTYATVLIGGQCWFAENLRANTFRNGENIPVATPDNPLHTMGMSARVAYAYDNARVDSLGWLYNGFVAIDDRGACPAGWSVPTDEEFKDLERHLGMPEDEVQGTSFRGSDEAFALKSSSVDEPGWNGTNTTGFSAIPSGVHYDSFSGVESSVQFWCRDGLGFNSDNYYRTFTAGGRIYRSTHNISDGHTIRCLKD